MYSYTIIAHKRVSKALSKIQEQALKNRMRESIEKLTGRYRIIFHVDKKKRVIFVTHLGKRESVYES